MALPSPRLDDRRFDDLMREAEALIRQRCPVWTDLNPGDPGITLVEVFAYLTDIMLYRLNRIPEKVHVALLNLLGVVPLPPAAAIVTLTFTRTGDLGQTLRVPAGTQVADPSGAVVFATVEDLVLAEGAERGTVAAVNAEQVEGELLGSGTGEAGQSVRMRRPPVLRPTGTLSTFVLGVEATADELRGDMLARSFAGKAFILWNEVDGFAGAAATQARPYVVDRTTGVVAFAPARGHAELKGQAAGDVPGRGRDMRAWYWRGGGRAGNVAAGTLTTLKSPIPGLQVTNERRAEGGEDGETVEAAIARGREAVRVLRTAVTARDFERVALQAGGIARARAFAQRDVWVFGEPGLVEVQIVPAIDPAGLPDGAVTLQALAERQTPELLARVEALLAESCPLAVRKRTSFTRCRPVSVTATVVIARVENPDAVRARLLARLNRLLSPSGTWPFERTLRASDVFETILGEPGVRYAEELSFRVEGGPETGVRDVVRDPHQARTFYVATEGGLFRSLDQGRSWARLEDGIEDAHFLLVRCHAEMPGLLAAIAERPSGAWAVYASRDGGERWRLHDVIQNEQVYDAAWLTRDGRPALLLATRRALRRLELAGDQGSTNVEGLMKGEDGTADDNGFFAVAAARHALGVPFVALGAREKRGVLVSLEGGEPGTFQLLPGSTGKDVRVLAFQRESGRTFLWAGMAAEAGAEGDGLMRIEARADGLDPGGWTPVRNGWRGGSCDGVDFCGAAVVAASNRAGILTLEGTGTDAAWQAPTIDCGLPINTDRNALVPVGSVAAAATGEGMLVLAGTQAGLFASADGKRYRQIGTTWFTEQVPLPPNWLYCSGEHAIEVVREQQEIEG